MIQSTLESETRHGEARRCGNTWHATLMSDVDQPEILFLLRELEIPEKPGSSAQDGTRGGWAARATQKGTTSYFFALFQTLAEK